jgi:butyryl-CoA dehydrogenase
MVERDIDLALANSAVYLEFFGHVVVGWMWLKQGLVAATELASEPHADDEAFYRGKLQAMNYFARWELPHTRTWGELLRNLDDTPYAMQASWF